MRGWTLLILKVKGQGNNGHLIYGYQLVNTIEATSKPLCASSSNMADILNMVRGRTLLNLEVKGQGYNVHVLK